MLHPYADPYPEHGPIGVGHNPAHPNWQQEVQSAAENLGFFGGNPHPNPAHPIPLDGQVNLEPVALQNGNRDNEDIADMELDPWDQAVQAQAGQNLVHNNPVPRAHPQFPQDVIDVDHSGSSLRFLRALGRDLPLQLVFGSGSISDDSSSTSSDAISLLDEQESRFSALQMQCLNHLVFDKCLFANNDSLEQGDQGQQTGLEIVPWKPVPHVVAMYVIADYIEFKQHAPAQQNLPAISAPILLPGPVVSSPSFEFESAASQPSPPRRRVGRPPKPRNTSLTSSSSFSRPSSVPLVESSVRRSPRIRGDEDGFKHVHLGKRQRREVALLSIPAPDGNTGPIPTEILKSWGIACGVQPEVISDEVLFQAPAPGNPEVSNED